MCCGDWSTRGYGVYDRACAEPHAPGYCSPWAKYPREGPMGGLMTAQLLCRVIPLVCAIVSTIPNETQTMCCLSSCLSFLPSLPLPYLPHLSFSLFLFFYIYFIYLFIYLFVCVFVYLFVLSNCLLLLSLFSPARRKRERDHPGIDTLASNHVRKSSLQLFTAVSLPVNIYLSLCLSLLE